MPVAAARPCRRMGCGALVRDGSGYCAAHVRDSAAGKFADAQRGSRHERGYGQAWDVLRKQVLARDKGLCQVHLKQGKYRPASQVDHIVPKFEQGTDDMSNLQSICKECHTAKTAEEALRARRAG